MEFRLHLLSCFRQHVVSGNRHSGSGGGSHRPGVQDSGTCVGHAVALTPLTSLGVMPVVSQSIGEQRTKGFMHILATLCP